jgi:hypothetical protein
MCPIRELTGRFWHTFGRVVGVIPGFVLLPQFLNCSPESILRRTQASQH